MDFMLMLIIGEKKVLCHIYVSIGHNMFPNPYAAIYVSKDYLNGSI